MSRLLRALAALAMLVASAPALAFLRSTTVQYHPDQGLWLWWGTRNVTFHVNDSTFANVPGCGGKDAAVAAAVDSFARWTNAAGSDFTYVDGGNTSSLVQNKDDRTNNVVIRTSLCSAYAAQDANCRSSSTMSQCVQAHNCFQYADSSILAITTVGFLPDTGEIKDADMELHGWDGLTSSSGFYFTCTGTGSACVGNELYAATATCVGMDLANTITHEAGHVLGLDHPCEFPQPENPTPHVDCHNADAAMQATTMYPTAPVGETDKRSLEVDDIAGIATIYPTGKATVTSLTSSSGNSSGGCSSTGGAGLSLLGLGVALWRRRPRQPGRSGRP